MSKYLLSALLLILGLNAHAADFCSWQESQKLSDICVTVKEKMKFKKCDSTWVTPVSRRSPDMKTLRSIKSGLISLGYQVNEAEYAKLERLLINLSGEEVSYKLRKARAKLFDSRRACANRMKLMKVFE